jgi:hypothetical protein
VLIGEKIVTPESNLMKSVESALTGYGQAVTIKETNNAKIAIAIKSVLFISLSN